MVFEVQLLSGSGFKPVLLPPPAGSVYRDEFDLAILKMQEDNRLKILKRKWWEGGKCPKEGDHRAKGAIQPLVHTLFLC